MPPAAPASPCRFAPYNDIRRLGSNLGNTAFSAKKRKNIRKKLKLKLQVMTISTGESVVQYAKLQHIRA